MTTHNSSFSRILAVWMVLIAFLCGMILPSFAIARVEIVIATEGDPEDGLDYSGGGGGTSDGSGGQLKLHRNFLRTYDFSVEFGYISQPNFFFVVPVFPNQIPAFSLSEIQWKAIK